MATLEAKFDLEQVAWTLERQEVQVPTPCTRLPYHTGEHCKNCGGTGTRYLTQRVGPWQPKPVRIDAVAWDHSGVRYFAGGGWQGGEEYGADDLYLTLDEVQAVAVERNAQEGR